MKVIISSGGKFNIFNVTQQLQKKDILERLITSYPKFEVAKYGIPKSKVKSVVLKEILERGWKKLPNFFGDIYNPQHFIHEVFDLFASRYLTDADIVQGGASFCLRTLRRAKERGAITIVDRGNSHIRYQNKIVKEEYERFSIKAPPFQLPHPRIIEKEIQEYTEADYIVIPSLFVKRSFIEEAVPESKLVLNRYGVDLSLFKQIPKTDNVFRIIFGGGLSLRKGTHYLLQAFSELSLPNAELLLVGMVNDEIKPFLAKYNKNVKQMSYRPLKELYKVYSQGSVFCLPSLEEGGGMVQHQAMACGLPVIGTVNSGAEDIVRDGVDGFVIPIRNVEALKEKILYLYENPDIRDAIGKSAKERVSVGFTWGDYGNRIVREYERILSLRKGAKFLA